MIFGTFKGSWKELLVVPAVFFIIWSKELATINHYFVWEFLVCVIRMQLTNGIVGVGWRMWVMGVVYSERNIWILLSNIVCYFITKNNKDIMSIVIL